MEWKGPREWAIERDSVRNKKKYVERWGYDLEIVDMSTKKRYAHEWRESWEKVDTIRNCLRKYPDAEWYCRNLYARPACSAASIVHLLTDHDARFWWLDLNTFIMEPSKSLQSHIFSSLDSSPNIYRDINHYNPLNISHPLTSPFLDPLSLSPTGDNVSSSISLLIPQDCSGFNLGSFFMRRSTFSDRLLDIWWDPVLYEQKHMDWEHKEQDALEYLYISQPWIRPGVAFLEQRMVNSFPPGACAKEGEEGDEALDERIHYREEDRDFMVNMAGCEWGRDCWAEMYQYRELSNRLNRTWWEKFRDGWKERSARFKKGWMSGEGSTVGEKHD